MQLTRLAAHLTTLRPWCCTSLVRRELGVPRLSLVESQSLYSNHYGMGTPGVGMYNPTPFRVPHMYISAKSRTCTHTGLLAEVMFSLILRSITTEEFDRVQD